MGQAISHRFPQHIGLRVACLEAGVVRKNALTSRGDRILYLWIFLAIKICIFFFSEHVLSVVNIGKKLFMLTGISWSPFQTQKPENGGLLMWALGFWPS